MGAVMFGFAIAYVFWGYAVVGFFLAVLAIPFHAYPVMLQRRNRGRVLRMNRRFKVFANQAGRPGTVLSSKKVANGLP